MSEILGTIEPRNPKRARRSSSDSNSETIVDASASFAIKMLEMPEEEQKIFANYEFDTCNYLGGIMTCRNCCEPLFSKTNLTRLRISFKDTLLPQFLDCQDWMKSILYKEYQVRSLLCSPVLFRLILCCAERIFREMVVLNFCESY